MLRTISKVFTNSAKIDAVKMLVSAFKISTLTQVGLMLVLATTMIGPTEPLQVEIKQLGDGSNEDSTANIAFDLPDITATVDTTIGEVQLEAYKSLNNEAILSDATGKKISQLLWVSNGHPSIIRTKEQKDGNDFKLFHFSNRGFNCYVEMLTKSHRKILASAAKSKYQVNVSQNQVVNLILSSFMCTLLLYDDKGSKYLLSGKVTDFRHFPLRMDFPAPPKSKERELFLELINGSGADVQFDCSFVSNGGKLMRTNTLTIGGEQQQQLGLEAKLFGPVESKGPNEVYVTRDQMTELSSEMYSTLNIVEDYQMPEHEFSEAFVNDLIPQLASIQFAQVPIDTVLAGLSKYGFDIDTDIQPDVIKRDAGSILKIETFNNKSRIVVDDTKYSEFVNSQSSSHRRRTGFLGFGRTVSWTKSSSEKSVSKDRTYQEQLRELNTASRDEAEWEVVGTRVIPKTLNVARLTRSKLKKTLTFNRIRIKAFDAPFKRNFAIYTLRSSTAATILDQLTARVADLQKRKVGLGNLGNKTNTCKTGLTALNGRVGTLPARINTVSSQAVRRCRLCFRETANYGGRCAGHRNTCSGWSDAGAAWTLPFVDNTYGGYYCVYQWIVECQK